jgi:ABC-2 type transport system permease protein
MNFQKLFEVMSMKKEFLEARVRFTATLVIMVAIYILVIAFKNQAVSILQKSPELVEKFVSRGFIERLSDWSFYIYTQWFGKNFGQAVPIIGIIFAFPLISREVENGTIEFILTRRSRNKVFVEKISSTLILLTIGIVFLSLLPLTTALWISFDASKIDVLTLHSLLGAFLWYSIALLFSTISSDQVKPILASLGVLALSIIFGIVTKASFLNTYAYIMSANSKPVFDIAYFLIFLGITFASWQIFKKRDF